MPFDLELEDRYKICGVDQRFIRINLKRDDTSRGLSVEAAAQRVQKIMKGECTSHE